MHRYVFSESCISNELKLQLAFRFKHKPFFSFLPPVIDALVDAGSLCNSRLQDVYSHYFPEKTSLASAVTG